MCVCVCVCVCGGWGGGGGGGWDEKRAATKDIQKLASLRVAFH